MTFLTRLSLANRLIVGLAALAIVVFGGLATTALRQELLPSTQVPTAIVTAVYPGTSPDLVADEVATPLEQAISGVSGVTAVRSVSTNGLANLTVEWTYGLDNDEVVSDLRGAADGIAAELPDDVEVTVQAGSTDDIPVLVLAVASDDPLVTLARKVDDVMVPQVSGVTGVRQILVAGQDATQLTVTLRPDRLRANDLTAVQVTQAVQAQALVVPAGTSYRGDQELAIQVGTTPTAAKQVAAWPIPAPDGAVPLRDLATVEVESVEATTLARSDGRPALSLNVLKESDADAVEVSGAIRDLLPDLTRSLGANASAAVVFDQAPSIEKSIHDLAVEGGLGLLFAVLIILVFLLSIRSTLITAISIPLSLLVALIGLQVGDYSLNIFTLAALTVAVGRVVDDSIVVIENIKRRAGATAQLTPADIVTSVREVAGAVTASTLTTVAVFLPVALVEGITGELFRPFSITVAIALAASLLVSLTVVPVLAYWFMRGGRAGARAAEDEDRVTRLQRGYLPLLRGALRRPLVTALAAVLVFAGTMGAASLLKTDFLESFADKTTLQVDQELPVGTRLSGGSGPAARAAEDEDRVTRLQRGYLPLLRGALRRPLVTALAAVLVFAGTMGAASLLKTDFLESFADKTTLQVDQELPVGTRLSATSEAAEKVEAVLAASPGVKEYLTTVGQGGSHRASMFVSLTNEDAYEATTAELEAGFAALEDAGEVRLGSINTGTSNDLSLTVTGDDPTDLRATATRVEELLASTPGLVDVSSDLSDQRPLLEVEVDRDRAADLGFTSSEVGQAIAGALRGTPVGSVVLQGETRDIVVRPQSGGESSPRQIARLELPVSQLQQQQAVDRATDRLEAQRDELEADGEELRERGDALSEGQKALAEEQQAAGEDQQRQAQEAAAEQRAALRESRQEADSSLAETRAQLRRLQTDAPPAPRPPAVPGPAPGAPPVTQDQLAAQQAFERAAQRYAQYQQQVQQLQAAVAQGEAQLEQLDAQLDGAREQASASADQQAQQDRFRTQQEQLSADQEALAEEQQELTDRQAELAEEQAELAEIRARSIQVRDVADVRVEQTPSAVTQVDGTRAVTLTATPEGDDLGALTERVQSSIDGLTGVPAGVSIELGGASDDQAEAFRQLGLAMLGAIVIVFLIMVATFRSLVQPLVLLTSIPFAATGAVAGLLLTDTALAVPAMVGLLMLIGIVVTNAIVLMDLINQRRAQGEALQDAIVHGARLRLRPIIMTATATICALIPMGLGLTGGGAFIGQPLAVVVIGGLVTSTVLTLLLVPALYLLVERRGERRRLAAEARRPAVPDGEPQPG